MSRSEEPGADLTEATSAPLAADGGAPVRDRFLPVALPMVGEAEKQAVLDTFDSGWMTTGPKAIEFGRRIAELGGRISGRFPGAGLKVSPTRDLRSYRVSFARIQEALGFQTERSLESGIDEIAAWLAAHPELDHRAARFSNVLALQAMLHA